MRPVEPMKKRIAQIFLRWTGWEGEGGRPAHERFVLIAAPHTSNWDLVYLLAFAWVYDVRIAWMGKRQIFRWPFGRLMRALGGIPVVRERRTNMVDAMAATLRDFVPTDDRPLALVVPAEGTRGYSPYWKSGFYYIAQRAGVPIVMGTLDWSRRRGGFGPSLLPSGDLRADMDEVRAFYADKVGKFPDRFSPIRLKEE